MKTIEIKCHHCNDFFIKNLKVYNRDIKRNKNGRFFCCRECFNESQNTSELVSCKNCDTKFYKTKKDINKTNNNFCCHSCAAKFNNTIYTKRKLKTLSFDFCERLLTIIEKYGITKVSKKIKISKKTIKKNFMVHFGEDFIIPVKNSTHIITKKYLKTTKQELFSTRKNWQSARSGIQRRSRENYKRSEKPKYCKICGYNKHFEVAHIKSVSEFDDTDTVADMTDVENLVALCPNHHWEFDNGILEKSDIL